jgi:hypothetical protein
MKKLLFACLLTPAIASAQTAKYFGYYGGDYESTAAANPGGSGFPEMQDHINLYSILLWSADGSLGGKEGSENYVLGELAKAKSAHVHAIIPAFPFVFQQNGCWMNDPDAARAWSSLAQKMVDQGYLIPGDPAHSTVVATYLVDEPNSKDNCLSDINGQANPAWVNAINAIHQTPTTASLPIASIMTDDFENNMRQGIQLLDWVGFDHYGYSDNDWRNKMSTLKSVAPGKKYIIVPGAMDGCDDVKNEDPSRFTTSIETDPDVTWLAPFAWFSGAGGVSTCKGVRDIPQRRSTYTAEGHKITDLQCRSSLADKWFCGKSTNVNAAINYLLDD